MGYFLPKKYKFNHMYSFFLHDQLVDIIKNGERKNKFNVKVKIDNKKLINQFKNLKGEKLYEWLRKNSFEDELDMLIFKQIFIAVLSDFCHFIHTALNCSEKGKLSVTYSLLRKPLKDHLFILEWLLANPNDFLKKLNSEKSFELIAIDKVSKQEKIEIISKTQDMIPYKFFTPNFIYDIRYNKNVECGYEKLWQKSTHIVTSFKYIRTEKGNLNFIFSDEKAKISQWDHLYFLLPYLLFYTVEICMVFYFGIIAENEEIDEDILNRLIIGLIVSQSVSNNSYKVNFGKDTYNKFKELSINCKKCNKKIKFNRTIIEGIIKDFAIPCKCGNVIYLFDKMICA